MVPSQELFITSGCSPGARPLSAPLGSSPGAPPGAGGRGEGRPGPGLGRRRGGPGLRRGWAGAEAARADKGRGHPVVRQCGTPPPPPASAQPAPCTLQSQLPGATFSPGGPSPPTPRADPSAVVGTGAQPGGCFLFQTSVISVGKWGGSSSYPPPGPLGMGQAQAGEIPL